MFYESTSPARPAPRLGFAKALVRILRKAFRPPPPDLPDHLRRDIGLPLSDPHRRTLHKPRHPYL